MTKKNQKPAAASSKARRKSETLTLSRDAAWLLSKLIERDQAETLARYPSNVRTGADQLARVRRGMGNRMLCMAIEATLARKSLIDASAWWKLEPAQMAEEEWMARGALIHADIAPWEEPIDDAKETAAIALINAGKEVNRWTVL